MKTKTDQHSVKELRSIGIQRIRFAAQRTRDTEEERRQARAVRNVRESAVIEAARRRPNLRRTGGLSRRRPRERCGGIGIAPKLPPALRAERHQRADAIPKGR